MSKCEINIQWGNYITSLVIDSFEDQDELGTWFINEETLIKVSKNFKKEDVLSIIRDWLCITFGDEVKRENNWELIDEVSKDLTNNASIDYDKKEITFLWIYEKEED